MEVHDGYVPEETFGSCLDALPQACVEVDLEERFGVYSHFWDTASVAGADSRHTLNVVYRATQADPDTAIALDDQHDDYRFVTGDEDGLHEYVRRYLADLDAGRKRPDAT